MVVYLFHYYSKKFAAHEEEQKTFNIDGQGTLQISDTNQKKKKMFVKDYILVYFSHLVSVLTKDQCYLQRRKKETKNAILE